MSMSKSERTDLNQQPRENKYDPKILLHIFEEEETLLFLWVIYFCQHLM